MENRRLRLKEKVSEIIRKLKDINFHQQNNGINTLINKYTKANQILDNNSNSIHNPLNGSVRAYLEIFSDYENPILNDMYHVEKEMELYLSSLKKEDDSK